MMQITNEIDAAITRMISFGTALLKLMLEAVKCLQPMAIDTQLTPSRCTWNILTEGMFWQILR
jgi:hypothetical protein